MIVVRFLLRFLLVPFGGAVAVFVAMLVVILAHWSRLSALVSSDQTAGDDMVALAFVSPALAFMLWVVAVAMLAPATLGALLAEVFAIRSWIYHVANGGLSAWIGWTLMEDVRKEYALYNEPTIVIGAGIAAGFAYWAIAGWSAGFWKPVFAQPADVTSQPPARA